MNMWLVWVLLFILSGITLVPVSKSQLKGKKALVKSIGSLPCLTLGNTALPLTNLIGMGMLIFIVALVNDFTYAVWVGSVLGFLSILLVFTLLAIGLDFVSNSLLRNYDTDGKRYWLNSGNDSGEPISIFVLILVLSYMGLLIYFGGLIGGLFALLFLLAALILGQIFENSEAEGGLDYLLASARGLAHHTGTFRAIAAFAIFFILLVANLTPLTGNLEFNPLFEQLDESAENTGEPEVFLTDAKDVRVISWALATEYLQRAYSDAASTLSTEDVDLQLNTDPAYVNGRFVWVNAPRYEAFKWLGGKQVPFVVSVVNDPANMSQEGFEATTKSNDEFAAHRDRITWANRIDQLLHDRYGGSLIKIQIRITLDEAGQPWWVVYLGQRHVAYDVVTMKKILLINAADIDEHTEYDVGDPDIPEWMEVVYPDMYLFEWAKLWGKWREGIQYRLFTKRHLSYPDDTPRFLIFNQTPYWYVPMKQLDSKVLAGYILMNTRTGEATYFNRETLSLPDRSTAMTQVERYLLSGIEGFRKLTIHEGYLYPIKMDSGHIREAYIFPLYSGFTIQQFAIVDAQFYTQEPVLSTDLELALATYRAQDFSDPGNRTYDWVDWQIENGYIEADEAALTANGTTTVIFKKDLESGNVRDAENEWRELRLALSEFDRTGNATVAVTLAGGRVLDVDYAVADLVSH